MIVLQRLQITSSYKNLYKIIIIAFSLLSVFITDMEQEAMGEELITDFDVETNKPVLSSLQIGTGSHRGMN